MLFACEWLPGYLVELFEGLRGRLGEAGIELELTHGDPSPEYASRAGAATLPWAERVPNRRLAVGPHGVFWQPVTERALQADLVIVDQASRALFNYWLLGQQSRGRARMALWGHGENLNRHRAIAASEWVKRQVSRHPHWWFAYTEGSHARIRALGFPDERITVVQNAGATASLRSVLDALPLSGAAKSARASPWTLPGTASSLAASIPRSASTT